jgi:hypothetical protein
VGKCGWKYWNKVAACTKISLEKFGISQEIIADMHLHLKCVGNICK